MTSPRNVLASVVRAAFKREASFAVITSLEIPPIHGRLLPLLGAEDLQQLRLIEYCILRSQILGYENPLQERRLQEAWSRLLPPSTELPCFADASDSYGQGEAFGPAVRRLERELLVEKGWKKRREGQYLVELPIGKLYFQRTMDLYMSSPDTSLFFSDLSLSFRPERLLFLDASSYLLFGEQTRFVERYGCFLSLIQLLVQEIHARAAFAAS